MKPYNLSSPLLDSRVKSADTTKTEQILGYFVGPCMVYMMYSALAGTYLTQFYTDVLGLAGGFLTMMPLVSKLLSSVSSILIGRVIDRTRTSQGKARPWILCSGVLLSICGFLLYAVPRARWEIQMAWVVISYNLFFSLAFAVYSLSHSLMVPLSTRDTKQRDSLAMMTSMGTSMIPGMLSTIIMPLMIRRIGVGEQAQTAWLGVMSVLSILAIPATLIEYYFTVERVTKEGADMKRPLSDASFGQQIRACLRNKNWLIVIAFTVLLHFCGGISTSSQLYYCNWVLGESVEEGATKQILVNVIGQAPMGYGLFLLWPLVRKFGKRPVAIVGFSVAAVGNLLVLMAGDNLPVVLVSLLIKSTGSLPSYTMAAFLAEALDHVELENGFRVDGFSASVNSISQTVVMGLSQSLLLFGVNIFGYIPPESAAQIVAQPEAVRNFFSLCYSGIPVIGNALCVVLLILYKPVSKK